MNTIRWSTFGAALVLLSLLLAIGCDSSSSKHHDDYAGQWEGKVCGRDLSLTLTQNGTRLSGVYTLSGDNRPEYTEAITGGTVASLDPPAAATLTTSGGRIFEIEFSSYHSFRGTFYNNGAECDTSGSR